ncbi:MAG TPA: helix-turn-helix transcriptional regulator [Trueperaceae bacterium]|nr:helix-turn-helix transcriptional regulator [Trueperaceae bacterium]
MTERIRRAVRLALKDRGQLQVELAREISITPQYLSDLLRGAAGHMPGAWQKVLDALDLELVVLPKATAIGSTPAASAGPLRRPPGR